MEYDKSPIDVFFFSLYGFYPTKAGQAYELLTNAALKLINQDSNVFYDQFVKGVYSGQVYQIDGIIDESSIEAKDHSIKNDKVGRPEVQNQEGGLIDLPFKTGIFASATGYTRNAKKYAKSTKINPMAKRVELYNIRPSTENDAKGRVKTVIFNLVITGLCFKKAKIAPVFTKVGYTIMGEMFPKGIVSISINAIYNADGSVFITMEEWTRNLNYKHQIEENMTEITGNADFNEKCIKVNEQLIEIRGLNYIIPIQKITDEIRIQQDGKACLYVNNEDGTVDTLLTDIQMKRAVFDKDKKEIKIKPSLSEILCK